MRVSVIIPVLNERSCLPRNLAGLERQNWIHEIIVADGGSTDGTPAWLREQRGVRLIESGQGRGIQLNAGAKASTGDLLVFLHADTRLPPDAGDCLRRALRNAKVAGGCFCVRFDAHRPRSLSIVTAGINLRTRLTNTATGDQTIFVRRSVFERIGGFPVWPLFEDIEFVSRMKRIGRFAVVPTTVTISARRHVRCGVFRTVILCYLLRLGYWVGISPFILAAWYEGPAHNVKTQAALSTPPLSSIVSEEDSPILHPRRS